MNFVSSPILNPLKVLVTNPHIPTAQMIITKIMSGQVFGRNQLIDLILLVYSNEKPSAENYKSELKCCAFACMNTIEVSSDVPCITDADVFCFVSTLKNPNSIDLQEIDEEQFDALYLIIKVANNLLIPELPAKDDSAEIIAKKRNVKEETVSRKPIIIADGLVTLDILKSLSHNIPSDVFFCPTPLTAIAKTVLGDYLKVRCNVINNIFVWAINDEVFHVEVNKPYIIHDKVNSDNCHGDSLGKKMFESLDLDYTQFNESWMKKEYIEKIQKMALKNPYGSIFRASAMAHTLNIIWKSRISDNESKFDCSMGIISDGSLGTIKGCPYVLPLELQNENYTINTLYKECPHVKQEVKRLNKTVKEVHSKLIKYCKTFLQENIINLAYVPVADDTVSAFSYNETNTSKSCVYVKP